MYVADMKKTTQNLEVFYFLVLKIPFKLMSINVLELFSKVVFNKDQGCYREPLDQLIFWSYSARSCSTKIKVAIESL